jgi:putative ABC transport system permease protein
MLGIALSTLRARKGGFAGSFIALLLATTLVGACGILLETGLRADIPTQRYAAAPLVVAGPQQLAIAKPGSEQPEFEPLPERPRLDAALAQRIQAVDGVGAAVAEVSFPAHVVTPTGAVVPGPPGRDSLRNCWGHAWDSAVLTPFTLTAGRGPTRPGEVVMDAELARRAGVRTGDRVTVQATSAARAYQVSGIATAPGAGGLSRQSTLFFATAEAQRLAGHPGRVDAIGVLAAPGVATATLRMRVAAALDGTDAQVHTGGDRGAVEFREAVDAKALLLELVEPFGGIALLVALFVVAGTFAFSVQQRAREIALLRAVAATPRQVRRMICREAQIVALAAGIAGAIPAVALAGWLRAQLVERGLVPDAFTLRLSPLPVVVAILAGLATAWLAAWLAARRVSRVRPTQALGESAVEPRRMSVVRLLLGLVFCVVGVGILAASANAQGEAAAASAGGIAMALIIAAALLSPVLARVAAWVLGGPLRLLSQTTGYLAVANARANSRRLGSVITPLILAIGFIGTVVFAQTTIGHAAQRQARAGMLGDRVLVAGTGVPPEVAATVGDLPGVAAATAVVQTSSIVAYKELGDSIVQTFGAQGVTPDGLPQTMDLGVRVGSMDQLRAGTVAVSELAAGTIGANVGERIRLRLGDGTPVTLRVVATYERGLGFGDFTFPYDTIQGHVTDPLAHAVLVRLADRADPGEVDAALAGLTRRYRGLGVLDRAGFQAAQTQEQALNTWVNLLMAGVLLGYIAVSAANSLVMGTSERARELALLRLVGTTRRQVLRMMRWEGVIVVAAATVIGVVIAGLTLAALSVGLTGTPVPYVPPLGGAALLVGVAALGMTAILVPTRLALRANPAEAIAVRE